MSGQRRWPRIELALKVRAAFDSLEDAAARTTDVSRAGLFLATSSLRPAGTLVRLSFTITDPPLQLDLEGVVVRVQEACDGRPAGLGVSLTRSNEAWERLCDMRATPPR